MNKIKVFFIFFLLVFTASTKAQTFTYDFTTGYDGWSGDFADYPIGDSIFYELEFTRTTLPLPLNSSKYALKISGNNHSDDLFMFIKRKINGLLPNTTYRIEMEVEFASNAPTNMFGVGGAPGEGVTMKAGATLIEPIKTIVTGGYRMNIDKANQTVPGTDMDTIGHVGVSDTTTVFTLIQRSNTSHAFTITTNSAGEVWICIGSDSGFEATTTLFYNSITLNFTNITGLDENNFAKEISIFPNPASDFIVLEIDPSLVGETYQIIDMNGKHVYNGQFNSENNLLSVKHWVSGSYFLHIDVPTSRTYQFMKK